MKDVPILLDFISIRHLRKGNRKCRLFQYLGRATPSSSSPTTQLAAKSPNLRSIYTPLNIPHNNSFLFISSIFDKTKKFTKKFSNLCIKYIQNEIQIQCELSMN